MVYTQSGSRPAGRRGDLHAQRVSVLTCCVAGAAQPRVAPGSMLDSGALGQGADTLLLPVPPPASLGTYENCAALFFGECK